MLRAAIRTVLVGVAAMSLLLWGQVPSHAIEAWTGSILVSTLGSSVSQAVEPYGGSVSLSADRTQLDTEYPVAQLSLSTSKPLSTYKVGVYDDTGRRQYQVDAGGFTGSLTVGAPAHATRTFTAYVASSLPSDRPPSTPETVSAPVSITHNGYAGTVSLSADRTQLDTEHPVAKLSLSTSKPLSTYKVGVYDDTGRRQYQVDAGGFTGSLTVGAPAHSTRTFTAYVAPSMPSDRPPATPETVSVPVSITHNGYAGTVSLSADRAQLDTEHPVAQLSLSTSKPLSTYKVGVYDDTGRRQYQMDAGGFTGSLTVGAPDHTTRTFTAYVAVSLPSDRPPATPETVSAPVTITSIPVGEHLDGVSLATLEADGVTRYGSALAFCLAVGTAAPSNAALHSSAPDATLVCNAGGLRALVEWMVPIIGATATAAFLWQQVYGSNTTPSSTGTPEPPTTAPPRRPDLDRTLVASLARKLIVRLTDNNNPSDNFTPAEKYPEVADKVAQQCLAQAVQLAGVTADECDTKTIFVPGRDAYGAAKNDQAAIAQGMPWKLHWVKGPLNGLPENWRTNADQLCGQQQRPNPDDQCDEYPFYSTNEAGPANELNPQGGLLAWVPEPENGREGDALSVMVRCPGFESGERPTPPSSGILGTAYLVVPLPDTVDTTFICGTDTTKGG